MRSPWRGVETSTSRSAAEEIAFPRLFNQLEQRAVKGQQVGEGLLQQKAGAGVEKLLGGRVDEDDFLLLPHHQNGMGREAAIRPVPKGSA